jgi:curved DNA-binding protein CbpA
MDVPANLDSLLENSAFFPRKSAGRVVTHYGVLQVERGASKTKIREAFIRLKHTYSTQSQALYSLLDDDEARRSLQEVEEAFKVLNDERLRKEYDEQLVRDGVVERSQDLESPLVDPFGGSGSTVGRESSSGLNFFTSRLDEPSPTPWPELEPAGEEKVRQKHGLQKAPREFASTLKLANKAQSEGMRETVEELIAQAPEKGDGALFRKIRELLEVSEWEIQQRTKISLEYIRAIENNAYDRFLALVYMRGFLRSYLQYLGVQEHVVLVEAFSERMKDWQKTRGAN